VEFVELECNSRLELVELELVELELLQLELDVLDVDGRRLRRLGLSLARDSPACRQLA
jgi:hypothetical protein